MKVKYDAKFDNPTYAEVERASINMMQRFTDGELDAVHVVYMNFISTGVQKPEVMQLLPLSGVAQHLAHMGQQVAEKDAQAAAGALATSTRAPATAAGPGVLKSETVYDFSPDARELLDYLLPVAVKTALFQAFLDAISSENVARMVAMKSATDNADKMIKALTMRYNRARQSQITTELAEIMGGVEAMNK
jgi:F-type H+-transporting ATPase subunit gamma